MSQFHQSAFEAQSSLPHRSLAICSVGELFGGVEQHILGLLAGLRSKGISAPLLVFHDKELAHRARCHGFEVEVLPSSTTSILQTSYKLAMQLKRRKIQVLHVHGYKATVYSALARFWFPCSIIKTEHGLPESASNGLTNRVRTRAYHCLDNLATAWAVGTTCYVTADLCAQYARTRSQNQSVVIRNGVSDIDKPSLPRPAEFDTNTFNLAIVGRLVAVKGHRFAIEALANSDIPESVHLYLVGEGPCEPDLRSLAVSRGIAARVHFLGFRRNIYDYIAHCHALLTPSLHEGLPYTILEAMSLSTPIIASKVGGLQEILQHEDTALLVPRGDVLALAGAICRLHGNRDLGIRLGEAARKVQEATYSLESMTSRYIDLYTQAQLARMS